MSLLRALIRGRCRQALQLEPTTRYPLGDEDAFFTPVPGTHQRLENGNVLITESTAGRIFEVTREGEVVWDYRLPYDDETTSLFEAGMRVPVDYFEVLDWECEGS